METDISGIYSLLSYGLRHNDDLYQCISYIRRYLPAFKGVEQILYHYGNGGSWPAYRYCKAGKKRWEAYLYGVLLLGRYHGGIPAHAEGAGNLVRDYDELLNSLPHQLIQEALFI